MRYSDDPDAMPRRLRLRGGAAVNARIVWAILFECINGAQSVASRSYPINPYWLYLCRYRHDFPLVRRFNNVVKKGQN